MRNVAPLCRNDVNMVKPCKYVMMVIKRNDGKLTENRFSQICWLHTEWCIGVINPSYLEWTTNNKKNKPLIKL